MPPGSNAIRRVLRKGSDKSGAPKASQALPAPPKGTPRVEVFAQPIGDATAPIKRAQKQAQKKVARAEAQLPREHRVPTFPKLRRYTPEQRHEIVTKTTQALTRIANEDGIPHHRVAGVVAQRAKDQGDEGTLQTLRQFKSAYAKQTAPIARTRGEHGRAFELLPLAQHLRLGTEEGSPGPEKPKRSLADSQTVDLAGIKVPLSGPLGLLGLGGKAGVETGRAIAEDPSGVAKASIRTGIESIAGIPQGLKMLRDNPSGALSAIAHDYESRYGPILEGDWATFRHRLQTDYGVTPYVLDAAAAAGGIGTAAGAASRSTAVGRLATRLAESRGPLSRTLGKLMLEAHRTATTERPPLRFSGGEAGVVPQATSRNLFVAAAQRVLDTKRVRSFAKKAENAGWRVDEHGQLHPIPGREQRRLPALRPGPDEVVPALSARETPLLSAFVGRARRDLAVEKGAARSRLLRTRADADKQIREALKPLTRDQQRALKYAVQLGAPSDHAGLVRVLERRRAQIKRARKEKGARVVAPVLASTNDELSLIGAILKDPERFATPQLRVAADKLRELQAETEAHDPGLAPDQATIRRLTPQAAFLGLTRNPDVAHFEAHLAALDQAHDLPAGTHAAIGGHLARLHPDARPGAARQVERDLAAVRGRADRAHEAAKRQAARERARVTERETRGTPLETADLRAARAELAVAKRERRVAGGALRRAERRAGWSHGRAERDVARAASRDRSAAAAHAEELRQATGARDERLTLAQYHRERAAVERKAGDERAAMQHDDSAAHYERQAKRADAKLRKLAHDAPSPRPLLLDRLQHHEGDAAALQHELRRAEVRVATARKQLRDTEKAAPRVSAAAQRRLDEAIARVNESRIARDQARAAHNIAQRLRGEIKRKSTMQLESADAFQERVTKAAKAADLSEPGYWASSARPDGEASLAAIGSGGRATAAPKRYTGSLFTLGVEEHGPEVLARGVDRNIKRRFGWALVTRNMEVHAFEWSRGRGGEGLTATELKRQFDRRAIDPRSVAIIDSRIARRRAPEAEGQLRGSVHDTGHVDEDVFATLHDDLVAAHRRLEDLSHDQVTGQALNRYLVVPRDVYDELNRATRPAGRTSRMFEIALKQKPARVILGALNVPWLAFQIASNAFLSGLGGVHNPLSIAGAIRWWKKLPKEERDALEPYLGIGYHHALDEPHLGATAENSRLVNAWHGWRSTAVGRALHKANPLDAMFKLDQTQNDFWRRVLFYDKTRREAYARMGHNMGVVFRAQQKLVAVLKQPSREQLAAIVRDEPIFRRHAKAVNDWLGDYTTWTARERELFQRHVMFAGYLRFSLRFTFWTMPVEHPIMADLLSNLGRLGSQEVKRILGVPPDYRVPTNMLARMYFGGHEAAKRGDLRSLPIGRLNPFLNTVTGIERPEQLIGLVSPVYGLAVDQVEQRSTFTGKTWRIKGTTTPAESERPGSYFGSMLSLLNPAAYAIPGVSQGHPRNRILERALLSFAFPYRVAEQGALVGPQSDDALAWSPESMRYKSSAVRKSVGKSVKADQAEGVTGRILSAFAVAPSHDVSPQVLEREIQKELALSKYVRRHRRGHTSAAAFGGSGSGSGAFGR